LKKKDLLDVRGSCDVPVLVTNPSWNRGTAVFELQQIGSLAVTGKPSGHCSSGSEPAKLEISGFAPDESPESLALSVHSILQTPEQYLAALGVAFGYNAEDNLSAPLLGATPTGGGPKLLLNVYASYTEPHAG